MSDVTPFGYRYPKVREPIILPFKNRSAKFSLIRDRFLSRQHSKTTLMTSGAFGTKSCHDRASMNAAKSSLYEDGVCPPQVQVDKCSYLFTRKESLKRWTDLVILFSGNCWKSIRRHIGSFDLSETSLIACFRTITVSAFVKNTKKETFASLMFLKILLDIMFHPEASKGSLTS